MNVRSYNILLFCITGLVVACNPKDESSKTKTTVNTDEYHNHRSELTNSSNRFQQEREGRIAFLGGSITYNGGWRDSLEQYFTLKYPDTKFEFIRAGIPSMGSTPSAFRLDRDVTSKGRIDLLFQEAAVNDDTNDRSSLEQHRAMEGIVRHLRASNPFMDIVFMHFVDPGKMITYRADSIPEVIQNHEFVAEHYNIPSINLAEEVTHRIENQEFTWDDDFVNLHPSSFGQGVYAHSMIKFLDESLNLDSGRSGDLHSHPMPDILTEGAYDNGKLIDIAEAKYDNGWHINENWIPTDSIGTRDNYHHVPMLTSTIPGSQLQFEFIGSAVGIAVAAGQDSGIIEYKIDDGPWRSQNLFTKWSASLHLPWYYTLAAGITNTKHILELKVSQQKDERSVGTACRIRYFYVNAQSNHKFK